MGGQFFLPLLCLQNILYYSMYNTIKSNPLYSNKSQSAPQCFISTDPLQNKSQLVPHWLIPTYSQADSIRLV
jgi:hypothetical protein